MFAMIVQYMVRYAFGYSRHTNRLRLTELGFIVQATLNKLKGDNFMIFGMCHVKTRPHYFFQNLNQTFLTLLCSPILLVYSEA